MSTDFEALYNAARRIITEMRYQLEAQHKYIAELEKQLEAEVVAEIKTELEAQR